MSFASDCKNEIMKIKRNKDENKALILGMINTGASISLNNVKFKSATPDTASYFGFLMKKMYNIESIYNEENIQSSNFLHTYTCETELPGEIFDELELQDFGLLKQKIIDDDKLTTSYLAGAFLARGSVNDPNTSKYHFEISLSDSSNATFILRIINKGDFNAKVIKRKNRFVVYIKDAEKIVDLLRLIGSTKSAFHYEDVRIERDFNNSINRVINCEVANEQKTITAAREQLKYIKYLYYNYPLEKLDPKLLTLMKVRQDNPEASLVELIEIFEKEYGMKISKPGLCHRFAKIKEIATDDYMKRNNKTL